MQTPILHQAAWLPAIAVLSILAGCQMFVPTVPEPEPAAKSRDEAVAPTLSAATDRDEAVAPALSTARPAD